jgi:hypothetical protein
MEPSSQKLEPRSLTPNKAKHLIEFGKSRAIKKFISSVFRTINRYRSRLFQNFQKVIKVQFFLKTLSKFLNPTRKKFEAFWFLKQLDPSSEELKIIQLFSTLSKISSNFTSRIQSACFHRILFHRKSVFISAPEKTFLQIKNFYFKEVEKSFLKLEKRMKNHELISKNRAYMKIIAYYKYLKSLSLFPYRNSPSKSPQNSPSASPMRMVPRSSYSPERYKVVPMSKNSDPLYYPLFKMVVFIEQSNFMACAKSFKFWKFQKIFYSIN